MNVNSKLRARQVKRTRGLLGTVLASAVPKAAEPKTLDAVTGLHAEDTGDGKVVLGWNRVNKSASGWRICRNGEFWQLLYHYSYGAQKAVVDFDPDTASTYQVEAFTIVDDGYAFGPKAIVAAPQMFRPTPNSVQPNEMCEGDDRQSQKLADRVNWTSNLAFEQRRKARNAQGVFYAAAALVDDTFLAAQMQEEMVAAGIDALYLLNQAATAEAAAAEALQIFEDYKARNWESRSAPRFDNDNALAASTVVGSRPGLFGPDRVQLRAIPVVSNLDEDFLTSNN